jgi:hypothetical protein
MHRNPELVDLAPGDILWVSERQLGAFFSPETFMFVLDPVTRRAARHVARWHGCRFEFNQASGSAVFMKRGRAAGLVLSSIESLTLWWAHLLASMRLAAHQGEMERRSSAPSQSAG